MWTNSVVIYKNCPEENTRPKGENLPNVVTLPVSNLRMSNRFITSPGMLPKHALHKCAKH
jgi:hypothetical protein